MPTSCGPNTIGNNPPITAEEVRIHQIKAILFAGSFSLGSWRKKLTHATFIWTFLHRCDRKLQLGFTFCKLQETCLSHAKTFCCIRQWTRWHPFTCTDSFFQCSALNSAIHCKWRYWPVKYHIRAGEGACNAL